LSRNRHFELCCDENLYSVVSVQIVKSYYLLIVQAVDLKLLIIIETFKQWHHYLEKSSHSIEILTNHNNLCEFINVKMLNKKQTQWTVKLAVFNFVILHRLSKINFIDVLSRHLDYVKVISESIDKFLSTLQKKLTAMFATMFKFLTIISCFETVCQACEEWIDMKSRKFQLN